MTFDSNQLIDDTELDINITPLIDIVFLLLIFFMVTATFDQTRSLAIQLPKSSSGAVSKTQKIIALDISADKTIEFEGKRLSIDALTAALKKALNKAPSRAMILRADKRVDHGLVVEVLDLAKKAGIQKIAIAAVSK